MSAGSPPTGEWGPPVGAGPAPWALPAPGARRPVEPVAAGGVAADLPEGWQRLHPLSPVVRAGRSLVALLIPVALAFGSGTRAGDLGVDAALVGAVLLLGFVTWLVTRWRIEAGVLRIDTGLIRRSSRRFPLAQVQALDIVEPALARVLGLAEIRIRVAGSSGSAGRLAYLRVDEAERLRARLLALAHGLAEHSAPPPERALVAVDSRRLVLALVISGRGLMLEAVIVALVVLATTNPRLAGVSVSAGLTAFVGLATDVWRRLNSGYGLRVAEAADGFRVRSGLLQTTAETIPLGRVQAVRLVEPLTWRPFGWCRVDVDVAGKQRGGRENQAESRALRSLLPVGTRAQAASLLDRLVPGAPADRLRPPARARIKSPLRFSHLSWGINETFAVTTSGRLRRVTDWVPLAKVQSIRLVEGPAQRSLRLATVHLDTAGRSVRAALRDRDRSECGAVMDDLPERCRRARRQPGGMRP